MKTKILKIFIFLIITVVVLVGCAGKPDTIGIIEGTDEKEDLLKVYTSFYPYYDFAKNLGGDNIQLDTIVPTGTEPHSFEPSPKTIAELEKADVFIYNGLHMEPWVDRVLNLLEGKDIYIVDASKAVELINYDTKHNDDHNHEDEQEEEHDHDHGEYDPHIWVDPVNAIHISKMIKEAFIDVDPNNKNIYEENFNNFKGELDKLDESFRVGLKDATERKIIVSHSAFGYLARRYNIEEISVAGISPHAEPSPKRLAQLTKIANENKINYIFFEALANVKTAEVLAKEANLEVLTLYNVEGLTDKQNKNGEDYISLMYKNLETLKKALVK
ncbi:zinc ABC transporter substrate-binding protein [Alkaliphilus sp. MSJ-5]|uniref:Zinc ABC transporter substrate-binding protein n=1 Tax=Alkaliphilus flagellatus TaxID=2841507 RepID=A0ABS6G3W4_9FIRM|nr:zinc ABC transporter substrate-binding protein [Alkaliphilus flagellatus]MBU5677180.1 zinc ABC transporter substrate-binding protein [Alkaliphilus flagellatus]